MISLGVIERSGLLEVEMKVVASRAGDLSVMTCVFREAQDMRNEFDR